MQLSDVITLNCRFLNQLSTLHSDIRHYFVNNSLSAPLN